MAINNKKVCPVCYTDLSTGAFCSKCGFDTSCDAETYETLSRSSTPRKSVAQYQKELKTVASEADTWIGIVAAGTSALFCFFACFFEVVHWQLRLMLLAMMVITANQWSEIRKNVMQIGYKTFFGGEVLLLMFAVLCDSDILAFVVFSSMFACFLWVPMRAYAKWLRKRRVTAFWGKLILSVPLILMDLLVLFYLTKLYDELPKRMILFIYVMAMMGSASL